MVEYYLADCILFAAPMSSTVYPVRDPAPHPAALRIPPLETGDHLTREEFHRRYIARPDIQKAELIEGVVHVAAAARFSFHGRQDGVLITWLGTYAMSTPGVEIGGNTTTLFEDDNEYQPDGLLRIDTDAGGQSYIDDDGWLIGGPELIGEVSASSVSQDVHDKKIAYARHGVKEYIVWRVYDAEVDWFVLRDGNYDVLAPDSSGVIRSEVFPGLWLNVPALLRGEYPAVLGVLHEGIASPEHAAFAAGLQAKRTSR